MIKESKLMRQDVGRGNPERLKLGGSDENPQPYSDPKKC